jgi:hypothetical protein
MSQRDALELSIKAALFWCESNQIEPPLDLQLRACDAIKSLPFFTKTIQRLVRTLYDGFIGGEFVDILKNLVSGQMRKAYAEAWKEDGTGGPMPEYLTKAAADLASEQAQYVDGFYKAIVDARTEKTSIEPLKVRGDLWANRFNQAKNDAEAMIAEQNGGKLKWELGATEEHCATCAELNGKVAYAVEWNLLGLHPQGAKNDLLECGGWQCDCSLIPTDERKTTRSLTVLQGIAARRDGAAKSAAMKYDPSQPRDEQGQWTDTGGAPVEFVDMRKIDPLGNPDARFDKNRNVIQVNQEARDKYSPDVLRGIIAHEQAHLKIERIGRMKVESMVRNKILAEMPEEDDWQEAIRFMGGVSPYGEGYLLDRNMPTWLGIRENLAEVANYRAQGKEVNWIWSDIYDQVEAIK